MAYKISEDCISCGACAAECPVNAISEGDGKYEINPDVCIECGACAETCPVGAPAQALSDFAVLPAIILWPAFLLWKMPGI